MKLRHTAHTPNLFSTAVNETSTFSHTQTVCKEVCKFYLNSRRYVTGNEIVWFFVTWLKSRREIDLWPKTLLRRLNNGVCLTNVSVQWYFCLHNVANTNAHTHTHTHTHTGFIVIMWTLTATYVKWTLSVAYIYPNKNLIFWNIVWKRGKNIYANFQIRGFKFRSTYFSPSLLGLFIM